MTLATERLHKVSEWLDRSSQPYGEGGRFASIVPCDFTKPPEPTNQHPEALLIFVPLEQASGLSLAPFGERELKAPPSQIRCFDRIGHLLFLLSDYRELPPCALLGLESPTDAIGAALERYDMGKLDLAVTPVLAVPTWPFNGTLRAELQARLPFFPKPEAIDPPVNETPHARTWDKRSALRTIEVVWPT